jgi:hypothetical protein
MRITNRLGLPAASGPFTSALLIASALGFLGSLALAQSTAADEPARVVEVDCDTQGSLAAALASHGADTTYEVRGTCTESVRITDDGVTIDGGGEAILDAGEDAETPVVHIDGARRATLRGLTIQNGQHGVLVERLATVELQDLEVRDNRSHGVEVIQSHLRATDLHSHGNGRVGLIVNRSSEVRLTDSLLEDNGISGLVVFSTAVSRLEGENVIRGNDAQGFTLGLGGMLFTIGADLTIEENGAAGLSLLQGGAAQFLGGTLTVTGNAGDGIALDLASSIAFGMGDFQVPGEVTVTGNEGHGLSVVGDSHVIVDAIMPLTIEGNGASGLFVEASTVTVAGSTLQDNDGADLELTFGARATVDDTTVGRVACDEGVALRGAVGCP